MWDILLSDGQRVYGVASDDAHKYTGSYTPVKPLGGTGFIMLKSKNLHRVLYARHLMLDGFMLQLVLN
jgi:hypothetical protein